MIGRLIVLSIVGMAFAVTPGFAEEVEITSPGAADSTSATTDFLIFEGITLAMAGLAAIDPLAMGCTQFLGGLVTNLQLRDLDNPVGFMLMGLGIGTLSVVDTRHEEWKAFAVNVIGMNAIAGIVYLLRDEPDSTGGDAGLDGGAGGDERRADDGAGLEFFFAPNGAGLSIRF